jgi:crossover junction endodeoxyribonuclease RuvC
VKILGVDPGLRCTGYGLIEIVKGDLVLVEAGVVRTEADSGISTRLNKVHSALLELAEEVNPDVLVIEKLYAHYKHPATAILMGHVRGVVCLISGKMNIPLVSLPATHIKKSITGRGHSGKLQIQRMIQHTLGLKNLPEPPDVADALAIAISYAATIKNKRFANAVLK